MRTDWTIRPNALWHDGVPVTAADFVFALKTYVDPGMVINTTLPQQLIDRIEITDPKTFSVYWTQSYPWAAELTRRALDPLPEHIMGQVYATTDAQSYQADPFWSSPSYVGEGPYRLVSWEQGSSLVYRAFPDYFLGRPHIDEVDFRVMGDPNTVLAAVLSGDVDLTLGAPTLSQVSAVTLRDQWVQSGAGAIFVTPATLRRYQIQFDPGRLGEPALLDVRVRRAMYLAIDRDALAEAITYGLSPAVDIPLAPTDPAFTTMDQAIVKYPYDPVQAERLLREAGWVRSGGTVADANGLPLTVDLRTSVATDYQREMAIVANDLGQVGIQTNQTALPDSAYNDLQTQATFPGLQDTADLLGIPTGLRIASSAQCASATRRFAGVNRGCWSNPEFDRLYAIASSALEPGVRLQAAADAMRLVSTEVAFIPTHYGSQAIAVRKGITGPGPFWAAQGGAAWNIQDWKSTNDAA